MRSISSSSSRRPDCCSRWSKGLTSRAADLSRRPQSSHQLQPHGWATQVGRWDKDTLVIDTTGFNDKVWLEGNRPQTEQLHVSRTLSPDRSGPHVGRDHHRRSRRVHAALEGPPLLQLAPARRFRKYLCNENHKTEHFVGR
jgi:hypothetical protein